MLRMVPLHRDAEEESAAAGLILPHEMGEGNRPKDGGWGDETDRPKGDVLKV